MLDCGGGGTMKLAIMQPYFLPYIGYWQLMEYVDTYIVFDDVNYIKGGWINRNRILVNGAPTYINIPLRNVSQNKKINEIYIDKDERFINKELRKVQLAYSKAPYFESVYELLTKIYRCDEDVLSDLIVNSFRILNEYMGIDTRLVLSSTIDNDKSLKAQDKIIDICKRMNAKEYINAIGGKELYSYPEFEKQGINLSFLKTNNIEYSQLSREFVPNMSILDVLMNVDKNSIKGMLNKISIE